MTISSSYSSSYSTAAMQSVSRGERPSFEDMAQELLGSLDSDSDGSISLDEFSTAMSSNSSSSETSASSIFSLIDSGGDGSISTQELAAALEASRPKPPEGAPPPPPPPSESDESSKLSEIFSALDTNQDGSISQDELMALFEQDDSQSSDEQASSTQSKTANQANAMLERLISYYSANSLASTDSSLSLSA